MRTLVIAEAGVNHNGSLPRALEMVNVARAAGADVVKFQTFKSEQVISRSAPKAEYQRSTTPTSESQLEMARALEFDASAHRALIARCDEQGIEFMSSPFDLPSVDFLVSALNVSRIKIGSGEVTNFPLLLKVAQSGKPAILSTGMSTLDEIRTALGVLAFGYTSTGQPPADLRAFADLCGDEKCQRILREKVTLLQCTTEYPTPFEDANLAGMETLKHTFGLATGFSDHTEGIAVSIAAVARGASAIEKHFTLSRDLPGPDHRASLEPVELTALVRSVRQVEAAVGDGIKRPMPSEQKNLVIARKSLVAACSIKKGERFNEINLTTKRPGSGISAIYYWKVLGTVAPRDYEEDEVIVVE
jgi:N-acetylneuraminate synthase